MIPGNGASRFISKLLRRLQSQASHISQATQTTGHADFFAVFKSFNRRLHLQTYTLLLQAKQALYARFASFAGFTRFAAKQEASQNKGSAILQASQASLARYAYFVGYADYTLRKLRRLFRVEFQ